MSTILDALRKVQRERDRDSPDLRHALAQEEASSGVGFGPRHWLVVCGLVLIAVGVSAYLFVGGDRPGEAIARGDAATESAPGAERRAAAEPVRPTARQADLPPGVATRLAEAQAGGRKRRAARVARKKREPDFTNISEAQRRAIARRMKEAAAAAASQAAPEPAPEIPRGELVAAAEPVRTESGPTPTPAPAPVAQRRPAPEPAAQVARRPATAPTPLPEPVAEPGAEPVAEESPPPPRPLPRAPERKPEPTRVAALPPPEPPPERRPAGRIVESDPWEVSFPDLRLEAVRWHPDAARREARLLVDDTRSVAAREGDVIVGVAIQRIDPGAVELRLGNTTRLIRIGQ